MQAVKSTEVSSDNSSDKQAVSDLISDTESVGSRTDGPTGDDHAMLDGKPASEEPQVFEEADLQRAEEFKSKGNEFFKRKYFDLTLRREQASGGH